MRPHRSHGVAHQKQFARTLGAPRGGNRLRMDMKSVDDDAAPEADDTADDASILVANTILDIRAL